MVHINSKNLKVFLLIAATVGMFIYPLSSGECKIFSDQEIEGTLNGFVVIIGTKVSYDSVDIIIDGTFPIKVKSSDHDAIILELKAGRHHIFAEWKEAWNGTYRRKKGERKTKNIHIIAGKYVVMWVLNNHQQWGYREDGEKKYSRFILELKIENEKSGLVQDMYFNENDIYIGLAKIQDVKIKKMKCLHCSFNP